MCYVSCNSFLYFISIVVCQISAVLVDTSVVYIFDEKDWFASSVWTKY